MKSRESQKKPTVIITDGFSQKLRKHRWEEYEGELKHWEEVRGKAIAKFKEECAYWDKRKREYESSDLKASIQASGRNIVKTALSGGTLVVDIQPRSDKQQFRIKVPPGLKEGDLIPVSANGKVLQIAVPAGVKPGEEIQFEIPKAQEPKRAEVVEYPPPPVTDLDSILEAPTTGTPVTVDNHFNSNQKNTASSVPPPAIGSNVTPPAAIRGSSQAPPPAIGTANANGPRPAIPPPAIGGSSTNLNAKKSSQKLVKPGSFDFS